MTELQAVKGAIQHRSSRGAISLGRIEDVPRNGVVKIGLGSGAVAFPAEYGFSPLRFGLEPVQGFQRGFLGCRIGDGLGLPVAGLQNGLGRVSTGVRRIGLQVQDVPAKGYGSPQERQRTPAAEEADDGA